MKATTLPEHVERVLGELKDALTEQVGRAFHGLVVYGSLARGEYRPRTSDVNVIVVLGDTDTSTLELAAGPLRSARRKARVEPYVVAAGELARLADAFPIKVREMKTYHIVLAGPDPFEDVSVEPEYLRLGVERALRNHLVRMRRGFLSVAGDESAAQALLRQTLRSLRVELEAMLCLGQKECAATDQRSVFAAAADAFNLDRATLHRLATFDEAGDEDPGATLAEVLAVLERAAEIADLMEVEA